MADGAKDLIARYDTLLFEVSEIEEEIRDELGDLSTRRDDDLDSIEWGIKRLRALRDIKELIREKRGEILDDRADEDAAPSQH